MESNPAAGLIGFWMMLQLFATLALLIGGVYLMYCLGRAASGLDRMANAMEDWVALQNQIAQNTSPSAPSSPLAPPSTPVGSTQPAPPVATVAPTTSTEPRPEYSLPDEPNRQF